MSTAVAAERGRGGRPSTVCVECQRRKQRCNREWPCNNCHSRRVPDLCHFAVKKPNSNNTSESPPSNVEVAPSLRKRKLNDADEQESQADLDSQDVNNAIEAMGLKSSDQELNLAWNVIEKTIIAAGQESTAQASDIEAALRVILPRSYTDSLIQNFLNGGNYYYYIVYPPLFSEQYRNWWGDRTNGKPLRPELTCLILRVCACSAQYSSPGIRTAVEAELGEKFQALSQRFHTAAERLGATIAPGKGGLVQIQQISLSAFWFKSESRWTESWHALATAIHNAQEMGLHRDSPSVGLSEFARDMRRRIWCLLYVWDWQISLLFDRPLIINHVNCSFELPELKVDQPPIEDDAPSPYAYLLLQCQLFRSISDEFGVIENPLPLQTALVLQQFIQGWVNEFPAVYAVKDTDTTRDTEYPFLALQRPYLHAISYAMILVPLKPYIIKSLKNSATDEEKKARSCGVDVAIQFMDMAEVLFDQVYPNDTKFHFSFFALFDASILLCSAIMHDGHGTLPRQDDIIEYIGKAFDWLKQLVGTADMAAMAFKVLRRLVASLNLTPMERMVFCMSEAKRVKRQPGIEGLTSGVVSNSAELAWSPVLDILDVNGIVNPSSVKTDGSAINGANSVHVAEGMGCVGSVLDVSSAEDCSSQPFDFRFDSFLSASLADPAATAEHGDITEDFGSLGQIWNYDILGLPFTTQPLDDGLCINTIEDWTS